MALTYNWNTQTASQTDADSPTDTTLMEGIRQNLIYLKEVGTYGSNVGVELSGDFTIDNIQDKITFDTEIYDNNSDFHTGSSVFTPTIGGIYVALLNARVKSTNLTDGDVFAFDIIGTPGTQTVFYTASKSNHIINFPCFFAFEAASGNSFGWYARHDGAGDRFLDSLYTRLDIFKVGTPETL